MVFHWVIIGTSGWDAYRDTQEKGGENEGKKKYNKKKKNCILICASTSHVSNNFFFHFIYIEIQTDYINKDKKNCTKHML